MEMEVKSKSSHYYYGKLPTIRKSPRFPYLNATTNLVYEILVEENRRMSMAEIINLLPFVGRTIRFAITALKENGLIKSTRSMKDARTHIYYIDDEK